MVDYKLDLKIFKGDWLSDPIFKEVDITSGETGQIFTRKLELFHVGRFFDLFNEFFLIKSSPARSGIDGSKIGI